MYIFFNKQVYFADFEHKRMYATTYSNGALACDFKSELKLPSEIDCAYTLDEIIPLLMSTGYKANNIKTAKEK